MKQQNHQQQQIKPEMKQQNHQQQQIKPEMKQQNHQQQQIKPEMKQQHQQQQQQQIKQELQHQQPPLVRVSMKPNIQKQIIPPKPKLIEKEIYHNQNTILLSTISSKRTNSIDFSGTQTLPITNIESFNISQMKMTKKKSQLGSMSYKSSIANFTEENDDFKQFDEYAKTISHRQTSCMNNEEIYSRIDPYKKSKVNNTNNSGKSLSQNTTDKFITQTLSKNTFSKKPSSNLTLSSASNSANSASKKSSSSPVKIVNYSTHDTLSRRDAIKINNSTSNTISKNSEKYAAFSSINESIRTNGTMSKAGVHSILLDSNSNKNKSTRESSSRSSNPNGTARASIKTYETFESKNLKNISSKDGLILLDTNKRIASPQPQLQTQPQPPARTKSSRLSLSKQSYNQVNDLMTYKMYNFTKHDMEQAFY
jgi:hypothetical protein